MAGLNVVYNEDDLKDEYELIPDSLCNVMIIDSEKTPTKNAINEVKGFENDAMLVFKYKVIDGPSKGKGGFIRMNLWNSNPAKEGKLSAKQIAEKELNKLRYAVGKINSSESAEFHGIPFQAKIVIDGKYNKVVAFNPVGNSAQQQPIQNSAVPSFLKM